MGISGASRFPSLARICEAYWEREELPGGEIRFAASVAEVGREAGLSGGQVSRLAGIASVAVLGNTTCPECGGERWATNRTGYHDQIKAQIVGGPALAGVAQASLRRRARRHGAAGRPDESRRDAHETSQLVARWTSMPEDRDLGLLRAESGSLLPRQYAKHATA
ncbi:MAG TPA: hypothetical protein VF068_02110 [Rubrobacter sp.]